MTEELDSFDLAQSQPHPCEWPDCEIMVQYDDEPYCLQHSPDDGSHQRGYSYRRRHAESN